jgi:transposase
MHVLGMRYAQGGGLSLLGRARREALRFQAAELLAARAGPKDVAAELRVSPRSVRRWRASLAQGGEQALASKGPGGSTCRLDEVQLKVLEQALDEGPAAHGWAEDQRWTLPRVARLVFEMFRVTYTPRGISYLLHRIGWTPQVPQHVAAERDEEKMATWVRETWPHIKVLPSA